MKSLQINSIFIALIAMLVGFSSCEKSITSPVSPAAPIAVPDKFDGRFIITQSDCLEDPGYQLAIVNEGAARKSLVNFNNMPGVRLNAFVDNVGLLIPTQTVFFESGEYEISGRVEVNGQNISLSYSIERIDQEKSEKCICSARGFRG